MKAKNLLAFCLILLFALSGILFAKEYSNTSYYVAYDTADKTQFALVMPSVAKVYTHKAGHILPSDLTQIDTQFKSFPSYDNGELCFSDLKEGVFGSAGADIMAGKCYTVDFFYIQKDLVEDKGMTFILVYTPNDKVYEGLAGDAPSFEVVRDGDDVYNENSISGDDYTYFKFDKEHSRAVIDKEKLSKISIVAKDLNVTITDPLTALHYDITSNYDIKAFRVKINNVVRTELATLTNNHFVIQPTETAQLPFDYLITTLTFIDDNNYTYTEDFSYNVDFNTSISSGFSAEPQIGYAPLTVTFSPKVNAEESIQLYHWDFGDGTKNDSNTSRKNLIGSPVSHTYPNAGEYAVTLTIYDSNYQPATSELLVKVYNQPPVVTNINVSPSNGEFPLTSTFSASAQDHEGIREFLWDFNNDGKIDVNDSKIDVDNPDYILNYASSSTSYTYDKAGTYNAVLKVVDVNGSISEVSTPTISVLVGPEGTPTVTAYAYPVTGKAPMLVSFSSSWGTFSKWEWDFNGDGVFDYSSTTSGSVDHNYTTGGDYFAKLRVTNSDGLTSSDSIEITMNQSISLTRDTDTIDIKNAQFVGLDITVAGETDTKLVVEDRKYQFVKTLLDWKRRIGTISSTWDGTDSEGSIVAEGDYYIVLLYKEAGVVKRFDLRSERVAGQVKPITTNISAGTVFAPYLEPMMIEFNLTEAAEVSLDIGPDGSSVTERIKTLLLKQPMGKGVHTILWAGDANDGTLADLSLYKEKYPWDANYYMTGGFMDKLADNAVFVKSGVSVLNLTSDVPVYVPNAIGEDEKRKSLAISFDLTAAASVVLTINDAKSGATVVTRDTAPMKKGSHVMLWDGKDAEGKYIAPGTYRIGVKATDSYGHTSLTQYALQRIFY